MATDLTDTEQVKGDKTVLVFVLNSFLYIVITPVRSLWISFENLLKEQIYPVRPLKRSAVDV